MANNILSFPGDRDPTDELGPFGDDIRKHMAPDVEEDWEEDWGEGDDEWVPGEAPLLKAACG